MSNMQLGEDTTAMSMTLNPVNEAAFRKLYSLWRP